MTLNGVDQVRRWIIKARLSGVRTQMIPQPDGSMNLRVVGDGDQITTGDPDEAVAFLRET